MAASIIPMSLQEPLPTSALNVACMSQLWLLSAGFTTAFSALFYKIWRLNKLVRSSMRFKRMRVQIQDVLYPFVILLSLNFLLLTAWTLVDPLLWLLRADCQTNVYHTENFCLPVHVDGNSANTHPVFHIKESYFSRISEVNAK